MYFAAEIFRNQIISNMRTKLDSIIYLLPLSIIMSCFCLNINSQVVLQRCDVVNLWQGSNSLNVNSVDKQEGTASLDFTGSGTDWFAKWLELCSASDLLCKQERFSRSEGDQLFQVLPGPFWRYNRKTG